ncbi:hypothetical protein [Synechococcus sp. UW140]|uniref:hypothetical protein n=1 Tax=Synechococcus sp. UW140 TaxID=368503 RepID=UPI000E0F70DB|nr:hypothetical protein [Synechococcus sp. UW140]
MSIQSIAAITAAGLIMGTGTTALLSPPAEAASKSQYRQQLRRQQRQIRRLERHNRSLRRHGYAPRYRYERRYISPGAGLSLFGDGRGPGLYLSF